MIDHSTATLFDAYYYHDGERRKYNIVEGPVSAARIRRMYKEDGDCFNVRLAGTQR